MAEIDEGPAPANFYDRFIAFVIDTLPLAPLYFLCVQYFIPILALFLTAALFAWMQAMMLMRWQVTPGKWLLGISVFDLEGNAPTFKRGFCRTLTYWVSAVPLYAGFLAAWFDEDGRAWHDKITETVVLETSPQLGKVRAAIRVFSGFLMAVLAGGWLFLWVGLPVYLDFQHERDARQALQVLGFLQEKHFQREGHYAQDFDSLFPKGKTGVMLEDLKKVLDFNAGLAMDAGPKSFSIRARAKDGNGDILEISGPPPKLRVIRYP